MSRRITRSQTIYLENPSKLTKCVVANTKTPNKSTPTSRKRKTVGSSTLVEQAPVNLDASTTLNLLPKICIVPVQRLPFEVTFPSLVNRSAVDTPTSSKNHSSSKTWSTSEPLDKVTLARRSTYCEVKLRTALNGTGLTPELKKPIRTSVDSLADPCHEVSVGSDHTYACLSIKPISSRRKTISSAIPKVAKVPVRHSKRILKKTSTPIVIEAEPKKNSANWKPQAVIPSISTEIPIISDNLSSASTTKIANRRKSIPVDISKKHIKDSINRLKSTINGNEGHVEIAIPHELKKLLITDSNVIHRQRKCYKIPGTHNVAKVIEDYVASKQPGIKDEEQNGFTFKQIFENVIEYFDVLLGSQLLYDSERIHYLDVMIDFPGEKMSNLYPPIYLLRLIVQLNSLIQFSNRDKDSLRSIVIQLNDFSKYLAENTTVFADLNNVC